MFSSSFRWNLFWWAIGLGIVVSVIFFAISYWEMSPAVIEPDGASSTESFGPAQ